MIADVQVDAAPVGTLHLRRYGALYAGAVLLTLGGVIVYRAAASGRSPGEEVLAGAKIVLFLGVGLVFAWLRRHLKEHMFD